MTTVGDIYDFINHMAPFRTAMDFDNAGLLIGERRAEVKAVLLSLDITGEVIDEAKEMGAQLVLSHHPVIFQPLKKLNPHDIPYRLIQNQVAAICAHTNLDLALGGVNTCLANALRLTHQTPLKEYGDTGLAEGLIGELEAPLSPGEFAAYVKEHLHCGGVKFTMGNREVMTVGVGSGASAGLLFDAAMQGIDAFVTGDTKHHELLAAREMGITMVDAGHFNTEDVVIVPWMEALQKEFPQVTFQKSQETDPACYLSY